MILWLPCPARCRVGKRKELRSIELLETLQCYDRALRNVAAAFKWLLSDECPRTADWANDVNDIEHLGKSLDPGLQQLRQATAMSPFLSTGAGLA